MKTFSLIYSDSLCVKIIKALIVFSVTLLCMQYLEIFTISEIWLHRDINRALNLNNILVNYFGPETTGGGNLTGPSYYIYLKLWSYIWGDLNFSTFIKTYHISLSLSLTYFYMTINKYEGNIKSILIIMSFILSPFIIIYSLFPSNALYVGVFHFIIMSFIYRSYILSQKCYFYTLILTIGISVHFHGSLIIFLPTVIYLQQKKIRQNKKIINGIAIFSALQSPYFINKVINKINGITPKSQESAGEYTGAIKQLLDSSLLFDFHMISILENFALLLSGPTTIILLLFTKNIIEKKVKIGTVWKIVFIFSSVLLVWVQTYRYIFLFFLILHTVLLLSINTKQYKKSTIIFAVAGTLLFVFINSQSILKKYPQIFSSNFIPYQSAIKISDYLINSYKIDYQTFIKQTYLINIDELQDLKFIYKERLKKNKSVTTKTNELIGIIISYPSKNITLKNDIPEELINYQKSKKLKIRDKKVIDNFTIYIYEFKKDFGFLHINKIGQAYSNNNPPETSKRCTTHKKSYCASPQCLIFFKYCKKQDTFFEFQIGGKPLSSPGKFITPTFTMQIQNPQIIYNCKNEKHKIKLNLKIGFSRSLPRNYILAPFNIKTKLKCRHPSKISLSFSKVDASSQENINIDWKNESNRKI